MIQSWKGVEKFFNLLLVFLLPSQLALHFWPSFAFVFGIRVDYLAPTIYFTDLLFIILFVLWAVRENKRFLHNVYRGYIYIIAFLLIAFVNVGFSSSFYVSLFKWIKFSELAALAFYVYMRRDIFSSTEMSLVFFSSLIFFSIIGIAQFFKGGTIGGILYYLGERSFNISTPGIKLTRLGETSWLSAYSTFPHPNAFAGYLGVGTLMLLEKYFNKFLSIKSVGFIIILFAFIVTFSLSAILALVFCGILLKYINKSHHKKNTLTLVTLSFLVSSLLFTILSRPLISIRINYAQSVSQRLELAYVSGKIISSNFWTGIGLNTFIINEVKIGGLNSYLWLLQPVHNIYLLIFSETGVFGLLFLYLLFLSIIKKTIVSKHTDLLLAIVFVMITGLFDHYWLTLQQNMLLFSVLIGNSFAA